MKTPSLLIVLAALALCNAHAQVPSILNYQGRVTVGGTNLTTNAAQFKFALVDSNGATVYWKNDGTTTTNEPSNAVTVAVAQGLYSTLLGDTTLSNMAALPSAVFSNANVNLRTWFSAGGTNAFVKLSPDQRLGSSGYALRAATADSANVTNVSGDLAVSGTLSVGQLVGGVDSVALPSSGAAIGGGYANTASAPLATIGGGMQNTASDNFATIGGGQNNTASGYNGTVGGGKENVASSYYSTVGGGFGNTNSGYAATIGGGERNTAGTNWATVGGGIFNEATDESATVGGGRYNTASGYHSVVGGGAINRAIGACAAIGGGEFNLASDVYTMVGGGMENTASGDFATVPGGRQSTASGDSATVGGGMGNTASGSFATVSGGLHNTATNYAFAAGRRAKATNDGSFVWADSADDDFGSTGSNQFLVRAAGGLGINTNNPGTNALSVAGTASISGNLDVGSINGQTNFSSYATTFGFVQNNATAGLTLPAAEVVIATFVQQPGVSITSCSVVFYQIISGATGRINFRDATGATGGSPSTLNLTSPQIFNGGPLSSAWRSFEVAGVNISSTASPRIIQIVMTADLGNRINVSSITVGFTPN